MPAAVALGRLGNVRAADDLLARTADDPRVSHAAIEALCGFGDARVEASAMAWLAEAEEHGPVGEVDPWNDVVAVVARLKTVGVEGAVRRSLVDPSPERRRRALLLLSRWHPVVDDLLLRDLRTPERAIDPLDPITVDRVRAVAKELRMSFDEVRAEYEEIAPIFRLTLTW
jgi:hypothetical protein